MVVCLADWFFLAAVLVKTASPSRAGVNLLKTEEGMKG